MKNRIVVVEDDFQLQRAIQQALENEDYVVKTVSSAEEGLSEIRKSMPDLMLLDVRLPGMNGFDLCKKIKENPQWKPIMIIFLTTKSEDAHKVLGLEIGADDYITKPFSATELAARVKAVLRRGKQSEPEEIYTSDNVTVNLASHTTQVGKATLELPTKEFEILTLLLQKKGRVLTRPFLMESVWGQEYTATTRTIDTHIYRLRQNLGKKGDHIQSVGNLGYKWEE